jgi:AAA+ ATPase superfamily predicted ATPase
MSWGFYGRSAELDELARILARDRWFFARITGRRRIGKTTLVQRALAAANKRVFYVQIPDSAPAGVLSAVRDAMDTFELSESAFARPDSLLALSRLVEDLVLAGYVVALDEFQYFSRKHLAEFTSFLQARVDVLAARAGSVPGGLIVLGSLHAELVALLEDRDAPLYNRTTDHLELRHLDIASLLSLLDVHADRDPQRLLFLWNLFEGVPKFYRDAYEQGVLDADRRSLLAGMFFRSSSPLRAEADNWFLSELRGRYDVVLKYVARHPGCSHSDIEAHVREVSPGTAEQVGGYLRILTERYQMLERRQPIFAKRTARRGRYYLRDNFLRSWLAALHSPVSALSFRPEATLVAQADERLEQAEGHGLERLVAQLYEERSRLGVGDFALTQRIDGYWDRNDTELDLVAVNEDERVIRFGTSKRNAEKLPADLPGFAKHVERFLAAQPRYRAWRVERVALAPAIGAETRRLIEAQGVMAQDLDDLIEPLT